MNIEPDARRAPTATTNRDRIVALEFALQAYGRRLTVLEELVDSMSKADEIAEAVTAAMDHSRRARLTLTRKTLAGVAALVLLVPAVHDLFGWIG